MRTDRKLEDLLDKLVMQAASATTFMALTENQRAIAAVQLLISTTTRSGIAAFFEPGNKFLWPHAQQGLKLLHADRCHELFVAALGEVETNNTAGDALAQLSHQIVIKDFEFLYSAIRKYLADHFKQIKAVQE